MGAKIGIPQALLYYKYYPAWERFFEELDCEVIKNERSTKEIVDAGVRVAVDEACLPVKLFLGHVEYLKDRVDYIFAPRIVSISSKEYLCPKFMGLPDMIRYNITDLPPLIDITVNLRDNKFDFINSLLKIGEILDKSYWQLTKASLKGWIDLQKYYRELRNYDNRAEYKIAILGHEYIINDPHINMNLVQHLEKMKVDVITPEMLSCSAIKKGISHLSRDMFWTFGKQTMGAAHHFFERDDIDGMIQLTAFGCGPDSLVGEMIERKAKRRKNPPFMSLNLDEHTGEAGLITRLEAFVDMIKWESA